MANVREYWNAVAVKVKELKEGHPEGCLFVISEDNPQANVTPGSVSVVTVQRAAELLTARSHRVATESEMAAYHEHGLQNLRAARRAEMQANRNDPVSIGAAVAAAIRQHDLTAQVQAELAAEQHGPVKPPVTGKK